MNDTNELRDYATKAAIAGRIHESRNINQAADTIDRQAVRIKELEDVLQSMQARLKVLKDWTMVEGE